MRFTGLTLRFILLSFFLLGGCASQAALPPNAQASLAPPDTTLQSRSLEDVRIAPQDRLSISVFGVPEFDKEYSVDQSGIIKMPLIGEIVATGYTEYELALAIETELERAYLQDADVSVVIEGSIARQLTVDGAVKNPGLYPVQGRLQLLQAVALAGGTSETANPKRVLLFREINRQRMVAAFDLSAIRKGEAEDPEVFGNDIIVVDGSEIRAQYSNIIRSLSTLALFLAL